MQTVLDPFLAVKSVNTVIAAEDNIAANAEKCKSTLARDRDPYSKGTIFTRDYSQIIRSKVRSFLPLEHLFPIDRPPMKIRAECGEAPRWGQKFRNSRSRVITGSIKAAVGRRGMMVLPAWLVKIMETEGIPWAWANSRLYGDWNFTEHARPRSVNLGAKAILLNVSL